jgi:SAM-dependent methyltransferase
MRPLILPEGFPYPDLITALSPQDTMFDGRVDHYLKVGLSALEAIEVAMFGGPPPRTILDLPCGFGRVTRALRARYPEAAITVCDLDRQGVDFSAATFGARGVYSTRSFTDLTLGGSFDLIWVGSLLTHFSESQTLQFFDFALRHMGPHSRLVVTSHGEHVATQLRSNTYGLDEPAALGLLADYLTEGYGYRGYSGDPFYGVSLAARAWYEALFDGSPLRLTAYLARGWDRHQDVLVIQRAAESASSAATPVSRSPVFHRPEIAPPRPGAEQAARDAVRTTGFDTAYYRATYPDVAAAVDRGEQPSERAHYADYGWKEGRHPFDPQQSYARRAVPRPGAWIDGVAGGMGRVSAAWSTSPEDQAVDSGWYWMAHPAVRTRSNRLASGQPDQDAYGRLTALLQERGWTLPIERAISVGCGFGALERDLFARGILRSVDAYDIAAGAIAEAERLAREAGFTGLRYHLADLETIDLPPQSVDAVFAHSAVHHVERLEALYAVVQRTLRPGGVFHLHEYIGPTRFQWTEEQLRLANAYLDSLPGRLRQMPDGKPKPVLLRPTIEDMIAADPSESVRSADLLPAMAPFFEIIEIRRLGGALAHLALGGIAQNFDPQSPEDAAALQRLFDLEDAAMADGRIGSDFATITAIPKPLG